MFGTTWKTLDKVSTSVTIPWFNDIPSWTALAQIKIANWSINYRIWVHFIGALLIIYSIYPVHIQYVYLLPVLQLGKFKTPQFNCVLNVQKLKFIICPPVPLAAFNYCMSHALWCHMSVPGQCIRKCGCTFVCYCICEKAISFNKLN